MTISGISSKNPPKIPIFFAPAAGFWAFRPHFWAFQNSPQLLSELILFLLWNLQQTSLFSFMKKKKKWKCFNLTHPETFSETPRFPNYDWVDCFRVFPCFFNVSRTFLSFQSIEKAQTNSKNVKKHQKKIRPAAAQMVAKQGGGFLRRGEIFTRNTTDDF